MNKLLFLFILLGLRAAGSLGGGALFLGPPHAPALLQATAGVDGSKWDYCAKAVLVPFSWGFN